MQTRHKLSSGIAALALFCIGAINVQATTWNLNNIRSGNWNDQDARQANSYQIGFSSERPNMQAAYFEFDLTPLKGRTITSANMLIVGSSDFHISDVWTGHPAGQTTHQFKVGIAPSNGLFSLSQITTGNNIPNLFHRSCTAGWNPDNGYAWVTSGLHKGQRFDAWHYEGTKQHGTRLQDAVNAGGHFIMWACDRFDSSNDGENYVWGSTSFNAGNQLQIVTN
jgi:hypothetical protein